MKGLQKLVVLILPFTNSSTKIVFYSNICNYECQYKTISNKCINKYLKYKKTSQTQLDKYSYLHL